MQNYNELNSHTIKNRSISNIKIVFFFITVLLNPLQNGFTADSNPSSNLINGFANYQAGRVENIILDNFLIDLTKQQYLIQFFPDTSDSIKGYSGISGKRLIPLLSYYVEKDLEYIKEMADCIKEKIQVNSGESNLIFTSNTAIILDWLLTLYKENTLTTKDFLQNNPCTTTLPQVDKNPNKSNKLVTVFTNLIPINKTLTQDKLDEIISDKLKSSEPSTNETIKNNILLKQIDLQGFISAINNISGLKNIGNKENLYSIYVHQLSLALTALGFDVNRANYASFQKFRSSSLFLASLADASRIADGRTSSVAVAGIIGDFVNEDVVYKNKRNSTALYTRKVNAKNLLCKRFINCHNTWFIGSYFGLAFYDEFDEPGEASQFRAFGPVGLEFKLYSGPGYTTTLMYAPIDIGVYITSELEGNDFNAKFDDIKSPGAFFSISSRNSPMSLQFGYQKDIPLDNGKTDEKVFIAFSFDLPLFTLW